MVNRISFWYWCVADTCGQFWCYLSWPSSTVHRSFFIERSSLHFQTDPNSFYPTDTVMMPPFNEGLNCVFNGIFMTAKAITCLSTVTLIPLRFLRGGKRPYGCSAKALMSRARGNGALGKDNLHKGQYSTFRSKEIAPVLLDWFDTLGAFSTERVRWMLTGGDMQELTFEQGGAQGKIYQFHQNHADWETERSRPHWTPLRESARAFEEGWMGESETKPEKWFDLIWYSCPSLPSLGHLYPVTRPRRLLAVQVWSRITAFGLWHSRGRPRWF